MHEKLLLHIQYECARHKVDIPWDHIAHRLSKCLSHVHLHIPNAISHFLVNLSDTKPCGRRYSANAPYCDKKIRLTRLHRPWLLRQCYIPAACPSSPDLGFRGPLGPPSASEAGCSKAGPQGPWFRSQVSRWVSSPPLSSHETCHQYIAEERRKYGLTSLDRSEDFTTTEAVGWNEPFEDRRKNLPDAADFVDEEDVSMSTAATGDDSVNSYGFEDAEVDMDNGDLVKPGGKGKGNMPVKRQASHDSDARGNEKKTKISARHPLPTSRKKANALGFDGNNSEADEDADEDDIDETMQSSEEDEDETFADGVRKCPGSKTEAKIQVPLTSSASQSAPSRQATPATQLLSNTTLPDPFTTTTGTGSGSGTGTQPAILSAIPVTMASFAALQQQHQQQHHHQQQSTVGSPAHLRVTPDRQHGGITTTPSPIRSIPATLMISPDGQAWTVPAFHLNGAAMQMASTPMGPPALATVNSSPANFDFENATPRTAAAMRSVSASKP